MSDATNSASECACFHHAAPATSFVSLLALHVRSFQTSGFCVNASSLCNLLSHTGLACYPLEVHTQHVPHVRCSSMSLELQTSKTPQLWHIPGLRAGAFCSEQLLVRSPLANCPGNLPNIYRQTFQSILSARGYSSLQKDHLTKSTTKEISMA